MLRRQLLQYLMPFSSQMGSLDGFQFQKYCSLPFETSTPELFLTETGTVWLQDQLDDEGPIFVFNQGAWQQRTAGKPQLKLRGAWREDAIVSSDSQLLALSPHGGTKTLTPPVPIGAIGSVLVRRGDRFRAAVALSVLGPWTEYFEPPSKYCLSTDGKGMYRRAYSYLCHFAEGKWSKPALLPDEICWTFRILYSDEVRTVLSDQNGLLSIWQHAEAAVRYPKWAEAVVDPERDRSVYWVNTETTPWILVTKVGDWFTSIDRGRTWKELELPSLRMKIGSAWPDGFTRLGSDTWLVIARGSAFASPDRGKAWRELPHSEQIVGLVGRLGRRILLHTSKSVLVME